MLSLKKRKERAEHISQILDECFPNPQVPLNYSSPFTLLVAVVLSAQCTDARVNQVTEKLFSVADTPDKMKRLSPEKLESMIRSCGLSKTKSRNLIALSEKLLNDFNGEVPETFEALESLPGVGHKTASVIMSHIFNKPAFPVDTHIHRLAARWGLSDGKSVQKTETDLKAVFAPENWYKLHLQMIYFGRTYCKALGHQIENCPICKLYGKG